MNYSLVIATRNRADALRLSIPRMLDQSRPPTELIIADSSDNHEAVVNAVRAAVGRHPVKLSIRQTERGAAIQRNLGLELVNQPVVFFPDDDSIFFPSTAESIMKVYEEDSTQLIAAVCAAESLAPPDDFAIHRSAYKMSRADHWKQRILQARTRWEKRYIPDPVRVIGVGLIKSARLPTWAADRRVVPVEWMTGFRMTFRTDVIRKIQFDPILRRYSLFEDRDASLGAWSQGAVVAALDAKIFHFRSPENRDNGRRMGVQQLLNLAYVTAKHSAPGDISRARLQRFARYKTFLYRLSAQDTFSRERYRGAVAALEEIPSLASGGRASVAENYQRAMGRCLPD